MRTFLLAAVLCLAGCASLGRVDPATGTSPAEDIMAEVTSASALLPPPFNAIVPIGVGSVLGILIALGKAKEPEPPT